MFKVSRWISFSFARLAVWWEEVLLAGLVEGRMLGVVSSMSFFRGKVLVVVVSAFLGVDG